MEGLKNMPTLRNSATSAMLDGKIYVIGGYNSSYLNKVEEYNPITNTWQTKNKYSYC